MNDTARVRPVHPRAPVYRQRLSSASPWRFLLCMNREITADRVDARDAPPLERSRRRQDAVGHFARKVSHDLNNFATVIRTYGELLLADLPPGGRAHDDVLEIHRAAEAMVDYLKRVARFGRAGNAQARVVDVDALVHEAVFSLELLHVDLATIPIDVVASTGARIEVDSVWFVDVLHELLRNAREASPSGHAVTVTLSVRFAPSVPASADVSPVESRPAVVLTIADDGAGFAESVSAHPEDPFVTTKHDERGAGFGLALASAFARQAHGQLERTRTNGQTLVSLVLPSA